MCKCNLAIAIRVTLWLTITYCTFDHSSFDCPFDPLDIPYIGVEVFDLGCLLEIGVEVFDLGCTFEDIVEVVEAADPAL